MESSRTIVKGKFEGSKFLARGIKHAFEVLVIDLRRGVKMTDGRNETREPRQKLLFSSPPFIYSPHTNVTREEVMSQLRYLTPRKSFHAHARNNFEGPRLIRE